MEALAGETGAKTVVMGWTTLNQGCLDKVTFCLLFKAVFQLLRMLTLPKGKPYLPTSLWAFVFLSSLSRIC